MKFMERRGEIVRSTLREIILGLWSTWTRGEIVRSVWSAIWVMTIFFPPLGVSGKRLSHIFDRPLGIPWVIWSAGGLDRTFAIWRGPKFGCHSPSQNWKYFPLKEGGEKCCPLRRREKKVLPIQKKETKRVAHSEEGKNSVCSGRHPPLVWRRGWGVLLRLFHFTLYVNTYFSLISPHLTFHFPSEESRETIPGCLCQSRTSYLWAALIKYKKQQL